jgi:hypothetical protein
VNLQNPLSGVRRLDPRDPLVAFQNGVHIADPFGGDLDQVPVAASFVSGEEFPAGARVSRWGFAFRRGLDPGGAASAVSLSRETRAVSLGGAGLFPGMKSTQVRDPVPPPSKVFLLS